MRVAAILAATMCVVACSSEVAPRLDGRLEPAADWAQVPAGAVWGEVTAVDVDSHGHVFVLQRGTRGWVEPFPTAPIAYPTVYMFARDGRLLARWGERTMVMPHGLSVGRGEDNRDAVWITDAGREQVLRFSHDGALEAAWGTRGETGDEPGQFGRPADVADADGWIYVADGYTHARVAAFDRSGRLQRQWGQPGGGDDGFELPHGVALAGERVYVADRENSRIKVHRTDGTLLAIWPLPGHPYAVKPLPDGRIAVLEGRDAQDRSTAELRLFTPAGEQLAAYDIRATQGTTKGHDFAVAADGTIMVADVEGGRLLTVTLPAAKGE